MVTMTSEQIDDDEIDLKQTIINKLQRNGTLNRIQAELRSAIYLAIEESGDNIEEIRTTSSGSNGSLENSLIYNYLIHNRLPASAAVFEKEINMQLMSVDEIRNANPNVNRITAMFDIFLKPVSSSTDQTDVHTTSQHISPIIFSRMSDMLTDKPQQALKSSNVQMSVINSEALRTDKSHQKVDDLPTKGNIQILKSDTENKNNGIQKSRIVRQQSESKPEPASVDEQPKKTLDLKVIDKNNGSNDEGSEKGNSRLFEAEAVSSNGNDHISKGSKWSEKTDTQERNDNVNVTMHVQKVAEEQMKETNIKQTGIRTAISSSSTKDSNSSSETISSSSSSGSKPASPPIRPGSMLPPLKNTTNLPSIGNPLKPILPSSTSSLSRRLNAVLKMNSASDDKSSEADDIEEDINVDELLQSNDDDDSISF